MRFKAFGFATLAVLGVAWAVWAAAAPSGLAELKAAFLNPPDDARIMMRWWWFGPAVTNAELEREMRLMKEGGIGGFEVQATYPLALDDPSRGFQNGPYLSPAFLDSLRFAGAKARELGLRMDLTLASGWPYGGPHIPITQAAGRLRVLRTPVAAGATAVALPALTEGEGFIAAFLARGDVRQFAPDGIVRLSDIADGSVRLPAGTPEGRVALFFISSRTRMMVKRAAVGAEGFVLDHYDRAAIDNHLTNVGEKLLGALAATPPYAIFSDSLEVNASDWTGNFLAEFQKRRGYDLTPYLPALAGDNGEKTAAIRCDWGRTLTELAEENYLTPLAEFARRHGTRFRSQTYGTPTVALSSATHVDLPEGEGTQWRRFSATRWAASANHLYGNPVTSSETWTWLHSPVFRATPLDMKAEADLHFIQGVNQLIGHGWPYSPPEAGDPGWRFYAAAVFNNHNPWWFAMPEITRYLQRVSFLLRQGQPANDVAVYLPTSDAYAHFTLGRVSVNEAMDGLIGPNVIPAILDAGYNFDFIDDAALLHGRVPQRILILPGVERMPIEALRKIDELARNGTAVIALRRAPALAPGLVETDRDGAAIAQLSKTLFGSVGARGKLVTDETKLGDALHAALAPDVATAPEIGFVHRKLPFAEAYFLANTSNHPVKAQATFRVTGMNAAWWDPFTGATSPAQGGAALALDLAPYESRAVVFSRDQSAVLMNVLQVAPPGPVEAGGPWTVTFAGSAAKLTMASPQSWSGYDETKYYSGEGTYSTVLTVPPSMTRRTLFLDFGEGTPVTADERRSGSGMRAMLESPVREAARVYVNDKLAGVVWKPPYRIDVTGLIRAGQNRIRVAVGNLAINTMAKGPLPDYRELNAKYGERFQAQDMANLQPLPSGLLAPVRLVAK